MKNLKSSESGFSLVELIIGIVILMIVVGGIFGVIDVVNQRSSTEQAKLDMFQEAREFMDQMSRDLHQAGFPSYRHYLKEGVLTTSPMINDDKNAVGVVHVAKGDLWFEGDVDGTGIVSVVRYHYDDSTTGGCPCLRRSQLPKIDGNPVDGQTPEVYQIQVQGVQSDDIFSAFSRGTTGTPITLPVSFDTDGTAIANVDTVKATLSLRSPLADPKTGLHPVTTLVMTAKLSNCSQAADNQSMSCR